jgi:hypothetical protein
MSENDKKGILTYSKHFTVLVSLSLCLNYYYLLAIVLISHSLFVLYDYSQVESPTPLFSQNINSNTTQTKAYTASPYIFRS